jgi:ATP-dependent Lon protease
MRGLDRVVGKMLRKVARGVALDEPAPECIGVREVQQYLGARPFLDRIQPPLEQPGAALGLAWTPGGGEVLLIEAAAVPGSRSLILTGQIGDVMRESAMAALTYVRGNIRRFGVEPSALDHLEIHLHVPAGAIPKDGPSAGLAICVALASLVSGRMPTTGVAMTGEITLRGNILPVGGIEHKILGGHRLGLHTIVLPRGNEHSLDRMPKDVLRSMELKFVDDVESAIAIALQPTRHPGSAKSRPHPLEQTLH